MSRKKLIGIVAACIVVVIVVLVISLSGRSPVGDWVVTFRDPNLETAMRAALNKTSGPIYASELAGLVTLSASGKELEDLSGLQYCTNLTELDLISNQISDISPLVENEGLGTGDSVNLQVNPLSSDSINTYTPQLEERGVTVNY